MTPERLPTSVPFELQAIDADAVGLLLGLAARTVLETVACRPDFPVRVSMKPATWVAGEVLEWRDANRAGLRNRSARKRSSPAQLASERASSVAGIAND